MQMVIQYQASTDHMYKLEVYGLKLNSFSNLILCVVCVCESVCESVCMCVCAPLFRWPQRVKLLLHLQTPESLSLTPSNRKVELTD